LLEYVDEGPGGVDGGVPVEAAVEGAGFVVVVDGAALGVMDPEVVVGVVGGVLGVVDAGEGKGGEGDELGCVDDGRRDVGQGLEIGGGAGGFGFGQESGGERERKKGAEGSHGGPWLG
jgi:hypothetical protein